MTKENLRLKELRIATGMTQGDVAIATNKKQSSISAYELGTRMPDHNTKKKLAILFGVTVDYLFYDGELIAEDYLDTSKAAILKLEDRNAMIDSLITFSPKKKEYFDGLSDRRIIEEYERLTNL